ncbi:response regulator transcription factor [Chitinophaga sp.]|uniref:response regulator transcription factor n=1 Tax=Chitinophaga sp. TaxID=1869181 RepID=UPI002F945E02
MRNVDTLTILYAEDDTAAASNLKHSLEETGHFEVVIAGDGQIAWDVFNNQYFDVCLIDVHMPVLNGVDLAAKIRAVNTIVPIMYISADLKLETKLKGFSIGGADDYCEKPIQVPVLIPKMEALVRRAKEQAEVIVLDKYIFNTRDCTLTYDDAVFPLNQNEAKILKALIARVNKTIERETLEQIVFGLNKTRALYAAISMLRAHFRHIPIVDIFTIQRTGYLLSVPKDAVRYF